MKKNAENYYTTMKCVSQIGRTFSILKEDFELILRQKQNVLTNKIDILTAKLDSQNLNRIEDRGHLKKNFERIDQE